MEKELIKGIVFVATLVAGIVTAGFFHMNEVVIAPAAPTAPSFPSTGLWDRPSLIKLASTRLLHLVAVIK